MTHPSQLDESSVIDFLLANPDFLHRHSDLLTQMAIPAQHGVGTISLVERQQQAQRDKIRQIESNYAHLLQIGRQNDAISDKLHEFTLALIATRAMEQAQQIVQAHMQQHFNVDECSMIWWQAGEVAYSDLEKWLDDQAEPYCGQHPPAQITATLQQHYLSFACIPLKTDKQRGCMLLASAQADRFFDGMGTLYLQRIAGLINAVINHLDAA